MQQALPFDPHVYFRIAAENLLRNLGPKALTYADIALQKMKHIGDEEGFDLWLGIHEHLTNFAFDALNGTSEEQIRQIH